MASGFAQWGNDLYTGRRSYNIVGRRKSFYVVAAVAIIAAVVVMFAKGFNLGIEFRGGSEFRVSSIKEMSEDPAVDAVTSVAPTEEPRTTVLGSNSVRVQTSQLTEDQVEKVRTALAEAYGVDAAADVTSSFIGPTWGQDVSQKALTGLGVFLALLAVTMTLYFRNWRMALAAIIALFHDLIVTVGIYALIGWEVSPATVIGFLTILGYSVYDTVVVFDKVRENTVDVFSQSRSTYSERANLAINQTLVRSINTSVVALLPVSAILVVSTLVLGPGTLRDIALALFIGMAVGAYSSIFLATPLEVTLREREPRIVAHTKKVQERRAELLAEGADEGSGEVLAGVGGQVHLQPGTHQGVRSQPRRKRGR